MDSLPDCEEAVYVCVVEHEDWVEGGVFVLLGMSVGWNARGGEEEGVANICHVAPVPD